MIRKLGIYVLLALMSINLFACSFKGHTTHKILNVA